MITRPIEKKSLGLAMLAVSALTLGMTAARAQIPAPTAPTASPAFRSAFEGYQPYTDEKVVNWKAANDTTASIGGWRVYAKEAAQPAQTPQAPDAAAKPDPHAGHGKP